MAMRPTVGLRLAQIALLASGVLFLVAAMQLKASFVIPGRDFWLAIVAIGGMTLSATACMAFRMIRTIQDRASTNG